MSATFVVSLSVVLAFTVVSVDVDVFVLVVVSLLFYDFVQPQITKSAQITRLNVNMIFFIKKPPAIIFSREVIIMFGITR